MCFGLWSICKSDGKQAWWDLLRYNWKPGTQIHWGEGGPFEEGLGDCKGSGEWGSKRRIYLREGVYSHGSTPGKLYGLVKDHKPVETSSKLPPLREVVSGSGSNTEFLSAFVDHHLKAEVKKLPSYIEDTPDLLREIEKRNDLGPLPPHAIPVSMDVVALYPNVPWEKGLVLFKLQERDQINQYGQTSSSD